MRPRDLQPLYSTLLAILPTTAHRHGVIETSYSWRLLMSDRDSGNSFMWFLAGLGFGALLGVLYAPRSGRETREAIKNTAQEGTEYLKNRGREARDTVSQWVDRGKDVVNQKKEQISAAIDATRQAYREAAGEGKKGS
jgi:gas vesicle protein